MALDFDAITWPFLRSYIALLRRLPPSVSFWLSRLVVSAVLSGRKEVAKKNVLLALGSLEDGAAKRIVGASIEGLSKTVVEILRLEEEMDRLGDMVELRGFENLEPFKGKGGIILSLHMGNFPLMCLYLRTLGFDVVPIIRRFHNRKLAQFVEDLIRLYGMKIIYNRPKQRATMEILKTLRKGGFPFFAADQTAPGWEVRVSFFGVPVPTFRGPVVLHRRTGAPVIPMYTYRDRGKHVLVVEEPMDARFSGDLEEDLRVVNSWMEGIIKKHPECWFWFHRRWKRAKRDGSDDKG